MESPIQIVPVPEENTTVNFAVTQDKPFNQCFQCPSFRNGCSGPNIAVMAPPRACEFLQMTRVFLGYSYQHVADKTALSLATVKRNLNGAIKEPDFYTMSILARFLCGDPNGKYPCAVSDRKDGNLSEAALRDAIQDLERALADNADYRKVLDNIHDSYNAEMRKIREEAQEKIVFLRAQLDRAQKENDLLWEELARKSNQIDQLMHK